MLSSIVNCFKNLDIKIKNIMRLGFLFSLILCLFSTLILYTYHKFKINPIIFTTGAILFKTSLVFFESFLICGISFDKIIKNKP